MALATLIVLVNAVAGLLLAAFLGAAAALARPRLARLAGVCLAGFLGVVVLTLVVALPSAPYAALAVSVFLGAAWAAAPLDGPLARRERGGGALAGGALAAALGAVAAFDAFWLLPFVGLAGGTVLLLVRAWRARGEPEAGGDPPE